MKLYWHNSINFGDILSPYLLSKFAKLSVDDIGCVSHDTEERKVILTGSILSSPNIQNAVVFGAGFAYSNNYLTGNTILVKGVRGHKSLEKIKEHLTLDENTRISIADDVVIGEPSLCLPKFYNPLIGDRFELGIIPHIADYERTVELYGYEKDAKVIDLRRHDDETIPMCVERVIYQIAECKRTISSSLHGLIVSVAYGVPTDWFEIGVGTIIGDRFKFYDFVDSIMSIEEEVGYILPLDITLVKVPVQDIIKGHRAIRNEKVKIKDILKSDFLNHI